MESRTEFTVVQPTVTEADFDVTLHCVEQIGDLVRSILSFSYLIADGGHYTERSGDEISDEGDVIVEKLHALEVQIDHIPNAFNRCRDKLAKQNDELSKNRNGAKPIIDARPYHSAHDAIIALGRSLLAWARAWETDLNDAAEVSISLHRPTWNVATLKNNLGHACKHLVDPQFQVLDALTCSIAVATVDLWIFDAQYECRNAKARLAHFGPSSDIAENLPPFANWLYERREKDRLTWTEVESQYELHRSSQGWPRRSVSAIREDVKRYANFHGLPLSTGSGGRPKR